MLIHIGALTDKAGFKFAENADNGGPLGELVQWSDLIASLHLLGHKMEFSTEIDQLRGHLRGVRGKESCPTQVERSFDAIYIDIVGLKQFKKVTQGRLQHYRCSFVIKQLYSIPGLMARPCGLMDKASASGAGDCGFESHQGRFVCCFFFFLYLADSACI